MRLYIYNFFWAKKELTKLEELVLGTLSFLEPMTFSQVILDFNSEKLLSFPEFDKDQLQNTINSLEKKKLLKKVVIDKEEGWIRIQPKRSRIGLLMKFSWWPIFLQVRILKRALQAWLK